MASKLDKYCGFLFRAFKEKAHRAFTQPKIDCLMPYEIYGHSDRYIRSFDLLAKTVFQLPVDKPVSFDDRWKLAVGLSEFIEKEKLRDSSRVLSAKKALNQCISDFYDDYKIKQSAQMGHKARQRIAGQGGLHLVEC